MINVLQETNSELKKRCAFSNIEYEKANEVSHCFPPYKISKSQLGPVVGLGTFQRFLAVSITVSSNR